MREDVLVLQEFIWGFRLDAGRVGKPREQQGVLAHGRPWDERIFRSLPSRTMLGLWDLTRKSRKSPWRHLMPGSVTPQNSLQAWEMRMSLQNISGVQNKRGAPSPQPDLLYRSCALTCNF